MNAPDENNSNASDQSPSSLSLLAICRDLDSLNAEIQFVLSDFLTMRFAEIEQMLQSGQIDIAQMEHDQGKSSEEREKRGVVYEGQNDE